MDMIQVHEEAINGKVISQLLSTAYDKINADDPERAKVWLECILMDLSISTNKKIFIDKVE